MHPGPAIKNLICYLLITNYLKSWFWFFTTCFCENLFTLEKFIVTGPASDEFKTFTQENGFVIEYKNSVDGFIR